MQEAQEKPRVLVWVRVYCYWCAISSIVPALLVFCCPSQVEQIVSVFLLHTKNFNQWAVFQLLDGACFALAGYWCARRSVLAWSYIVIDPIATLLSVFLLAGEHLWGFGPYPSWLVVAHWYSLVIEVIEIVNLLTIPLSIAVSFTLLTKSVLSYFHTERLGRNATKVMLVFIVSMVIGICQVTSWGTILGLSEQLTVDPVPSIISPKDAFISVPVSKGSSKSKRLSR